MQKEAFQAQRESDEFFELVYDELRKIAAFKMSKEAPYSTLQATALVHEAWLRLGANQQPRWDSKAHFYHSAAEAMRRILIDRARKKRRKRHGGDFRRDYNQNLDTLSFDETEDQQVLAVNDAIEVFAKVHPEKAELVKLRYFVGLNLREAGEALNISERTAKRWWAFSKAWLYDKIART